MIVWTYFILLTYSNFQIKQFTYSTDIYGVPPKCSALCQIPGEVVVSNNRQNSFSYALGVIHNSFQTEGESFHKKDVFSSTSTGEGYETVCVCYRNNCLTPSR